MAFMYIEQLPSFITNIFQPGTQDPNAAANVQPYNPNLPGNAPAFDIDAAAKQYSEEQAAKEARHTKLLWGGIIIAGLLSAAYIWKVSEAKTMRARTTR